MPQQADALLLSAYAGGILFEGGLHAAARSGAFDSPKALLRYAAEQEQIGQSEDVKLCHKKYLKAIALLEG